MKPLKPEASRTPEEQRRVEQLLAHAGLPCLQCNSQRVRGAGQTPCPFCSLALPYRSDDGTGSLPEVPYYLAVLTPEVHQQAASRWKDCSNSKHRLPSRGAPVEACTTWGGAVEAIRLAPEATSGTGAASTSATLQLGLFP